ncbi:EF-Tu/IF-2/RF-3 family GTPase [Streptomyces sp. AC495_CC817]|uniref:EF-Tu/IF-2/RF-3 family GTPase n=1 Tax=Streptomyces sp. AC495_CC817 TaxID=2823900 RepID=UPI001C26A06E|nr:EF-Tu/IF-2/RF-3 family GTPase [Streptomyces sp. AC495_CC817]
MGWFRKKNDPQDANELLRRYNEAEAARLAGMTGGSAPTAARPSFSASPTTAEFTVEDVFTITGRGLVATGTVSSGTVRVGDAAAILRGAEQIGVTEIGGIEMFRKKASEASEGTMAGLLLRSKVDVARGDVIRTHASA